MSGQTISLTELPPTPEHDKFLAARKAPLGEHLSGFYDYLVSLGIQLMVWEESDEEVDCDDLWVPDGDHSRCLSCHGTKTVTRHHEGWAPTHLRPAELIAGYLGIDYKAFNDETEAVYQAVAQQAREAIREATGES